MHPAPTAAPPRLPGWRPHRHRKAAVTGALAVTLAALWALWAPPPRHAITPLESPVTTWLRLLPLPAMPAPPAADLPALRRPDTPARPMPPRAPAFPVPELPSTRAAEPQPITLAAPAAATPPATAASSPPPCGWATR